MIKIASDFSDPKVLNYGLPCGSCVGPQLFSYYTHPITDVIKQYSDVKYHFYADDTQLYICVDPRKPGETDHAISILSNCISEIKNWMSNNTCMLLLNDDKTDFFVAANPRLMNILSDISITIGNTVISPSHECLITSLQYMYAKLLTFIYGTYSVAHLALRGWSIIIDDGRNNSD